jgi:Cu(I)/Ag(I) efflux system membrane fusion protein
VLADLFEADLGRVKVGMGAELEIASLGKKLQGRVIFLDPVLDPKTRTLKARLEFPNPGGLLRPEMLGDVTFQIPERKALTVPLDAVLDSGTRKIVFVDVSQGHFEPREVTTGQQSADRVEIVEGLEKGEAVVTRAAFLVDSESRLQNALAEMTRRKSEATPGHRH